MDPLHVCAIILSLPLLWTLFLTTALLTLPICLIRWIIQKLAAYKHPEWAGMLTNNDLLFVEDITTSDAKPRSILFVCVTMDPGATLPELQQRFLQDVVLSRNSNGDLNFPKYQQYFEGWWGYR